MKTLHSLILLVFLFLSLVLSFSTPQTLLPEQYCLDDQRSPLLQLQQHLYYATSNFTFSSKFELWNLHTDCCSWEGVTCDALGHVIGLDLSYKDLSGTIHSIFDLYHLQSLKLAGNYFNSTLLSYGFDKLQNLTHLDLSRSCFHGQIPEEMSHLTRLVSLDLSNQKPCYWRNDDAFDYDYDPPTLKLEKPNLKTLIKNLKLLKKLYLDGMDLSHQSNEWSETTCLLLSNLQELSLSNCGLKGPLCSLSTLPFLSKLILDRNPISSLPPNFLKSSSRLVSLSLARCSLSGQFPTEIFLLPRIQSIDISENERLEGQLPEFPTNNVLRSLSLSFTNFSGKLPESIGNLKFLRALTLIGCNFFGSIPLSMPQISRLELLHIGGNSFSSMKLDMVFQLKNLRYLDLSDISLLIESRNMSLNDFSKLESLRLRSCNLTQFPEFIKTNDKLYWLDLSNNHIHGLVPNWLWKTSLSWANLSFNPIDFPKQFLLGDANFSSPMLLDLDLRSCNISVFPEILPEVYLDLSNNRISGAIPNRVWRKSLRYLSLANNQLSSLDQLLPNHSLTSSPICNMSQLSHFDVSHNNLSGPISNCLGNMSQLHYFYASHNNLSGPIPNCLGNMSQLRYFDASHNNLSGPIPNCLGNMSQLIYFDASHNNLSGPIPNCLGNMSQLSFFYASHNNLSGPIPNCLGNMSQLSFFDASHNNLSGPIPNCLGNMSRLIYFYASHNNLSGPIPYFLSNMRALSSLNLQGNNLSGVMPEFSKANQLELLKVGENRLEGRLPRSLAECTQLQFLDVGNNMMRDTFPFWLDKLPDLEILILRQNRFYGQIKHLKHKTGFPALEVLDIASNQFSGELSIAFHQATQLRTLKMGGNKLEGKLPRSLANCTKLEVLDLGNNMIHDTFPFWLELLPSLKVLILRGNKFYGTITEYDVGSGFQKLRIVDIASNNFSGDLPSEFLQSLKAMVKMTIEDKAKVEYIGDAYYRDSVTIFNKGIEMFYEKVLTILTCLDLSNNSFHGRIPEEIHLLRSLNVLNLSNNGFSGRIPLTLENLKDLESLDLSLNKLSGKIPPQLTGLTFLEALNFSYNQLEGSIPQSNQFITFSNDSYIGNPRLCGPPLSRKCNEVGLPMPPPPEEDEEDSWLDAMSTWKIALVGYVSGLVAGLCIGYTVLNELGNKWVDKFKKHGKKNRRTR